MNIFVSHVSKSFNGEEVLKDITFSIEKNERIAIVGKNGSGKSTLLKILAGKITKDSGTITIPQNTTIGYIPQVSEDESMSSLSSGQKTKKYLADLIREQPDILILDEPTNHLDSEGLEWLENYITFYHGAVILVSHDRMFLDNVASKVIELEDGETTMYGGNYTFYKIEKEKKLLAQERQYISQESQIKQLESQLHLNKQRGQVANKIKKRPGTGRGEAGFFANRQSQIFGSVGRNIEKQIDRIEKVERPQSIPELHALFAPRVQSGESVLLLKNVTKSFSTAILHDISFHIQRRDRIALVGKNGSGKSTLLKIITGELQPDSGTVSLGANVLIGYLSQEHSELSGEDTVLSELEQKNKLSTTDAYALLIRFLLSREKIGQSVNTLSSGEKAKLLLAEIMTAGSNFLILDEPTNHLDIASREAIEESIANYEGTLLVVSHDRYFLERVGITRVLYMEDGEVKEK